MVVSSRPALFTSVPPRPWCISSRCPSSLSRIAGLMLLARAASSDPVRPDGSCAACAHQSAGISA